MYNNYELMNFLEEVGQNSVRHSKIFMNQQKSKVATTTTLKSNWTPYYFNETGWVDFYNSFCLENITRKMLEVVVKDI